MRRIMTSWMTASPTVNQYAKETRIPNDRVVLESSTLLPCQHKTTTSQLFKLTAWRFEHLDSKVVPTLDTHFDSGVRIHILMVGFGLHNIRESVEVQEYWINRTVAVLSSHPASKHAKVFWTLPHKIVKPDIPLNDNFHIVSYNTLVKSLVTLPSWTVLDFFSLTVGKDSYAQDAVHFSPTIFRWKNQVMLNHLCPRRG
jgi:hypothetical protein